MDFIITVVLVIGLGIYKLNCSTDEIREQDVQFTYNTPSIPVGNNLFLAKEPDAFERIVKELGLK